MSETKDGRILDIIRALISQTELGHIVWSPTDDQEAFLYSGPSSSIIVDTSGAGRPQPYWIKILNERGAEVGRYQETVAHDTSGSELIKLYKLARKSALRIDDVLNSILKELRDLPPF